MPKCPSCNNEVVPGTRWCRIWILIDQDRQGWHDKLMSTYVVN